MSASDEEYSEDSYGSDDFEDSPRRSHKSNHSQSPSGGGGGGPVSVPPAVSNVTPLQAAQLRELQRENQKLRKELSSVNTQLDEQLSRKGHKVGHRPPPLMKHQQQQKNSGNGGGGAGAGGGTAGQQHVSVLDQRRKDNDRLRKRNHKVEEKLEGKDLIRMRELQNQFGDATRNTREFKDENRSLENVFANQRAKLSGVEKIEAEMSSARSESAEETRDIKDEIRRMNRLRDGEAGEMGKLRRQLERLESKIKVQDQVGQTVKSISELQEQVEEKDRTLESLKYQVAVLSKTNLTDKKRAKTRSGKVQQQLQDLKEEQELLQEKLNARGLADDLGVY